MVENLEDTELVQGCNEVRIYKLARRVLQVQVQYKGRSKHLGTVNFLNTTILWIQYLFFFFWPESPRFHLQMGFRTKRIRPLYHQLEEKITDQYAFSCGTSIYQKEFQIYFLWKSTLCSCIGLGFSSRIYETDCSYVISFRLYGCQDLE